MYLTQWDRVIFERLIVAQLINKFPIFYVNGRFITVFTIANHLTLS
jgi:hypothetical protein